MRPLEQETNIEVLRQYGLLATAETKRLKKLVDELSKILGDRAQEWLRENESGRDMSDQLSRLQKKFYGFGRESLVPKSSRAVGRPHEQLKLHGERGHVDWEENAADKVVSPDVGSPPEIIHHVMTDEDLREEDRLRALKAGKEAWKQMKKFYQDSVEITVTERIYKKVIHRQHKYKLKDEFNNTGKDVIVTAPGPVKLKPGCQYSVDFALSVVSDKYEYHLPLERQRRKMEAAGLEIDVKTLYSLCQSVSEHMGGVIKNIRQDIMEDFCALHIDESPWLITSEKHRGQMWAMSNRLGSYYRFEPTRSGAVAEEMLKGYTGSVLTDAMAAYKRLQGMEGIRKGLCWAHVRREFYERKEDFPAAEVMVRMIDELFDIEAKAKSFEELKRLRQIESRAVIILMEKWLMDEARRYLPGDGIRKAINYAAKNWTHLTTFLTDLSLPLSNNDAERALRHVVLGRKNFAGSRTINGADVAADLYTVIETAKKSGLQPKDYMKYVITENWFGRAPKSPTVFAREKFGVNKRVVFPPKNEWKIKLVELPTPLPEN
jgi:transposase